MKPRTSIVTSAIVSGTVSALLSTAVLAALSARRGRSAEQPLNATSHWLHGDGTASSPGVDVQRSGIGFATHHVSSIFWALLFEMLRRRQSRESDRFAASARCALATAAIAGTVDYGLVPKRLTPGWELVLPSRSVAAGFVALAAGLLAGGLIADQAHGRVRR